MHQVNQKAKKKIHKRSESAIPQNPSGYDQKDPSSLLNRVKNIFSTRQDFYKNTEFKEVEEIKEEESESRTRQFKIREKFKKIYSKEDPKKGSKNQKKGVREHHLILIMKKKLIFLHQF